MLRTRLTDLLSIDRPFIGAPMAGPGGGELARAVTAAGGLGMVGVGSTTPVDYVTEQAGIASDGGRQPFGIGLMAWAVERRPELLDATVAARPRLVSVSFGDPAPYADRLHEQGILVASQVHDVAEARHARQAGVDIVVAQGTDAGGHTGRVGTLPLLQLALDAVDGPVLAAGGIVTARGVAAALAAGADGVWVGTALLACPEAANTTDARRAVIGAQETDTVLTEVFDIAQEIPWPPGYAGRALRNTFTDTWHGREAQLREAAATPRGELRAARAADDYTVAYVYAGQGVGAVTQERPAAAVVQELCDGAEGLLRRWSSPSDA